MGSRNPRLAGTEVDPGQTKAYHPKMPVEPGSVVQPPKSIRSMTFAMLPASPAGLDRKCIGGPVPLTIPAKG